MTEELLKQKFGQENPFKVPEGYFDNFASKFMEQLPEEEPKAVEVEMPVAKRTWIRPMRRFAIAASFAAVLFGAVTYYASTGVNKDQDSQTEMASVALKNTETKSVQSDYMMDEMVDFAMIDNAEIYSYLIEN
jgi:hypothetical protein